MPATALHRSRLWLLIIALLAISIAPFCIWGGWFQEMSDLHGAKSWMESPGSSAWIGGMALLVCDLVLPVPGTVVMSALGLLYGWFLGGIASVAGSALSGVLAYAICWKFGRKPAVWLAGEDGLAKGEAIFRSQRGGWLVALSRWMPVLPEAVACLAGLTRMPFRVFFIALLSGSMPLGFAFSTIGAFGVERPGLAIALSALAPAALYAASALWLRKIRS